MKRFSPFLGKKTLVCSPLYSESRGREVWFILIWHLQLLRWSLCLISLGWLLALCLLAMTGPVGAVSSHSESLSNSWVKADLRLVQESSVISGEMQHLPLVSFPNWAFLGKLLAWKLHSCAELNGKSTSGPFPTEKVGIFLLIYEDQHVNFLQ